jgi:hypothetical protein
VIPERRPDSFTDLTRLHLEEHRVQVRHKMIASDPAEITALASAGGIIGVLAGQPAEILPSGRPFADGLSEPAQAVDFGFGGTRNGDEDMGRFDARERLVALIGGAYRRVRRVDLRRDHVIVQLLDQRQVYLAPDHRPDIYVGKPVGAREFGGEQGIGDPQLRYRIDDQWTGCRGLWHTDGGELGRQLNTQ